MTNEPNSVIDRVVVYYTNGGSNVVFSAKTEVSRAVGPTVTTAVPVQVPAPDYRQAVKAALSDTVFKTASVVAREAGVHRTSASTVFKEFVKANLVDVVMVKGRRGKPAMAVRKKKSVVNK
jgi:ribosomal protein L4